MKRDIINNKVTSVKVDFFIVGDYLDFDEITDQIGIIPDKITRKKEIKVESFAKDSWSIEIEYEESDNIEIQIKKIQLKLIDTVENINKILEKYKAECGINITIKVYEGEFPLLVLSRDMLKFWSSINAEICSYIYYECVNGDVMGVNGDDITQGTVRNH